jgi:tRNA threonylcarbamoyladenosine biosynthesis protein TsaE
VKTRSTSHATDSAKATEALAAALALELRPGQCIALDGDLGAGKTQFVRGLLTGLGGRPRTVNSPTFCLLNVYDTGRLKLFHLDAYRIGPVDLESIGFSELLEQGGIVAIEWSSRVTDALPPSRIQVTIETTGPLTRQIQIIRPAEL